MSRKFGFVAICGAPNAGKSTLLNALIGTKVAAVSDKPQTTRFNILGVTESGESQIAFVDTPGLFALQCKESVRLSLKKSAYKAIGGADVILTVVDISSKSLREGDRAVDLLLAKYGETGAKFVLAFNKIDRVAPSDVAQKAASFQKYDKIESFFMISAQKMANIDILKNELVRLLPAQEWMYPGSKFSMAPESGLADGGEDGEGSSMQFPPINKETERWASELTMEQIFRHFDKEIPYRVYIEPLHTENRNDGLHIYQNIIVSKESYKPIIIGTNGKMIHLIRTKAKVNIEGGLKRRVHLHLFVKVVKDWEKKDTSLKEAGFLQ
ncbi:MAG: GTPase Era [Holosporales bacterium]|jgi:GTP-binding protein Era|nr:GTPase Era [Holosporales bacterium]